MTEEEMKAAYAYMLAQSRDVKDLELIKESERPRAMPVVTEDGTARLQPFSVFEDAVQGEIDQLRLKAFRRVAHGTDDAVFTLTPNTCHVWDVMPQLTLSLPDTADGDWLSEYVFEFKSGATPTVLTLPAGVKWVNDIVMPIAANRTYQGSIVENVLVLGGVS